MAMTLQPYDGANRVRFPDGTECWEKETQIREMGGFASSYQYSVKIPDTVARDYYGRVIGLEMKAEDGRWNEVVNFFPVADTLIANVRGVLERGWGKQSMVLEIGHGGWEERVLQSEGYLKIGADVLALLETMKL